MLIAVLNYMASLLNSRPAFWLLLALPGIFMLGEYAAGTSDAMDMLKPTGDTSARLLIAALAVSPLMLLTGGARWVRWLLARRRNIGVAAFIYAMMHLLFYVVDMGDLASVLSEIPLPGIWTGWAALVLMLVLALTSNAASMRLLRTGWKPLQRLAYPAAVLTLLHWIIVHDGFTAALVHAAPLVALELNRLFHSFGRTLHNA